MNKPLLTKNMIEIGIFKFSKCFLRIWKTGEIYKINKMGERAKPYPIPMSTLKNGEEILF